MKNKEIENTIMALSSTYRKKLPVKLCYAIAKNVSKLQAELENVLKQRTRIMEDHCIKDEHGNPIFEENFYTFETPEAKQDAINEYSELLEIDAEVELTKIPFEFIEKCDESDRYDALTVEDLKALNFMIEE